MTTTEPGTPHPGDPETTAAELAASLPPSPNKSLVFGLSGLGIGLVVGLILGLAVIPAVGNLAGSIIAAVQPGPITSTVEACGVENNRWITIGDGGRSLSMDSFGEESDGADFDDIFCVLDELDTPDSVIKRINSTRSLDGRQSADWDGLSASWGYHPDNGLDIVRNVRSEHHQARRPID